MKEAAMVDDVDSVSRSDVPRLMRTTGALAILIASLGAFATVDVAPAVGLPFDDSEIIDPSAGGPSDLETIDWNGDGLIDLIAANRTTDDVSVWQNLGGGAWGELSPGFQLSGTRAVEVADIDSDGTDDFAVVATSGRIYVWLHRPTPLIVNLDLNFGGAYDVALGDIDRDGDIDLAAVAFDDDEIAWYENTGDAESWVKHVVFNSILEPTKVELADFDQDGDLDVLFAVEGSTGLTGWFENRVQSGETWLLRGIDLITDPANDLVVGDVDGDGDPDVVAASTIVTAALVWYENPHGSSTPLQWARHVIDAWPGASVEVTDLDADGDLDVLTGQDSPSILGGQIRWYENEGAGTTWTTNLVEAVVPGAQDVIVADLDADGDGDLVAASFGDNFVASLEQTSIHGRFAFNRFIRPTASSQAPEAQAVADIDRDGDADLLQFANGRLRWRENPSHQIHLLGEFNASLNGPHAFGATDMDGDGDIDAVLGLDTGLLWVENTGVGAQWSGRPVSGSGSSITHVIAADLTGDHVGDLVTYDSAMGRVVWRRNRGEGTSWTEGIIENGISALSDMTYGDLNQDGQVDVVLAFDSTLNAYGRVADIAWVPTVLSTRATRSVDLLDVDIDGDLDVVHLDVEDTVRFLANDGAGQVSPFGEVFDVADATTLRAGDLDRDGDPDVLVTSSPLGRILRNDRGAGFQQLGNLSSDLGVAVTAILDYDRDGDQDFLTFEPGAEGGINWNGGGQYRSVALDEPLPPSVLVLDGGVQVLARILIDHLGRPGEHDGLVTQWTPTFLDGAGVPWSAAMLDDAIATHAVYWDSNFNEVFDPGVDPEIFSSSSLSVVNGEATLGPFTGSEGLRIPSAFRGNYLYVVTTHDRESVPSAELRIELDAEDIELADAQAGALLRSQERDPIVIFRTLLDEAPIFADGFESGNTSAWSDEIP